MCVLNVKNLDNHRVNVARYVKKRWMVMGMFRKRKPFGEYPACDHLNCALRKLLDSAEENSVAIEEIVYAITKSNGYIYDDVKDALTKNNVLWFGERKDNENP